MSPIEIYKKFLLKVNKNDTNGNIKVPKSQFVLLFNEQKRKFIDDQLVQNESSDLIEGLEEILVSDELLEKISDYTLKTDFKLPDNFFKRISSYVLASSGDCKNQVLYTWAVKPKDINVYLQNENLKPSFNYRETIAVLNNGKVSVYKNGFTVNELYLTYYQEPKNIDIEGYTHIDGTPSTNIKTNLSDVNIELVIDRTATEALRNYENLEHLQIAMQREQFNQAL
jgi:hypothetical protein